VRRIAAAVTLLALLLSLGACSKDKATGPENHGLWQVAIGDSTNELGYAIVAVDGGDYIITGQAARAGKGDDVLVFRIDSTGNVLWENTFGGILADNAVAMAAGGDGGVACLGLSNSPGAMLVDLYVVKVTVGGALQWDHFYGGPDWDDGSAISAVPSGGFLLAGTSGGRAYVIKIDDAGGVIWDTKIATSSSSRASVVLPDTNGATMAIGRITIPSPGTSAIMTWELDGSGAEVSSRQYSGNGHDVCNDALRTADNGLLLVGWTESSGGGDMYALKLDSEGNEVWAKTYGGVSSDSACAVTATPDGGFVLAGSTESMGAGGVDAYLVKIDNEGTLIWQRTFGGPGEDRAQDVTMTGTGGLVIVGSTRALNQADNDVLVIKTDAEGNL